MALEELATGHGTPIIGKDRKKALKFFEVGCAVTACDLSAGYNEAAVHDL